MKARELWQHMRMLFAHAAERLRGRQGYDVLVPRLPGLDLPDLPNKSADRLLGGFSPILAPIARSRGLDEVLTDEEKSRQLRSLLRYGHSTLIVDGVVRQTMHALKLARSYFPHMLNVQAGNQRTPREVFDNDRLLQKAIFKRLKHGTFKFDGESGYRLSDSELRKGLLTYTGTQGVSNFRPTAAAAIYHYLLPERGGVTWDMSSGWGGRLLGAIACNKVHTYIGTDPSSLTFAGLENMRDELPAIAEQLGYRKLKVELYKLGSEVYVPEPNSLDLCFTSPPYFDTERYSDEPTQSYIKFPTPDTWLTGFMGQTLRNCAHGLKPNGLLAINIADVAAYPDLSRRFVEFAEQNGWKLVDTLKLALSSMIGSAKHRACPECIRLTEEKYRLSITDAYTGSWKRCSEHKYTYEPIFVFKRKFD